MTDRNDSQPGDAPGVSSSSLEDDVSTSTQNPSASHSDYIGRVFGDRFEIIDKIGKGGMGEVFKARQLTLERTVVIKLIGEHQLDDEVALKRFEREARSLTRLDHMNIVTVYDLGREGERMYIVMEYVEGQQLDELVHHEEALSIEQFIPIAGQLANAVGEAHRAGMIHRDLKPSNIMLTQKEEREHFVKILDFGLAKLVSGESDVTRDDKIVGSIPYLAPEQLHDGGIDERVDVYALGIVMYYMLTGKKPFEGSDASVLYDQVNTEPPPLSTHLDHPERIPQELDHLIMRCLRKEPDDRPDDAHAIFRQICAISDRSNPIASFYTTSELPEPKPPPETSPVDPREEDVQEPSSRELIGRDLNTPRHNEVPDPSAKIPEVEDMPDPPSQTHDDPPSGEVPSEVAQTSSRDRTGSGDDRSSRPVEVPSDQAPNPSEDASLAPTRSSHARHAEAPASEETEEDSAVGGDDVDETSRSGRVMAIGAGVGLLCCGVVAYLFASGAFESPSRNGTPSAPSSSASSETGAASKSTTNLAPSQAPSEESEDGPSESRRGTVEIADLQRGTLYVDGDAVGSLPTTTQLKPGSHRLEIRVDDRANWSREIDLEAGHTLQLEPQLPPAEEASGGSAPDESQDERGRGAPRAEESGARSADAPSTEPATGDESESRRDQAPDEPVDSPDDEASSRARQRDESGARDPVREGSTATSEGSESDEVASGSTDSEESASSQEEGANPSDSTSDAIETSSSDSDGQGQESDELLLPTESQESSSEESDDSSSNSDDNSSGLMPVE